MVVMAGVTTIGGGGGTWVRGDSGDGWRHRHSW